ncbi:hypothetical protein BKA69DRAFT_1175901 [Paraphysoderma sedebokerense]|nr:hypothetical protein BKA69DRAFT_1175901 [Paraphysoderma sedebokerense]
MSRFHSHSALYPMRADNNPSSFSPSPSPELFELDILPSWVLPQPSITDQSHFVDSTLLCGGGPQLQWDMSASLSSNQQHSPSPPSTMTYVHTTPEYIPRPSTFNTAIDNTHTHSTIKLTIMDAKRRRRTQNREAQRKFRERKENYLKDLEGKSNRLTELEKKYEELEKENEALKLKLLHLECLRN